MRHPYIGITDFETTQQVNNMLVVFNRAKEESLNPIKHKLMVGLMISYKTLNNIPSKWSSVWVPKENIKDIFIDHPLAYDALHYADYDGKTEAKHLVSAIKYGGENIHSLQLDMIWPSAQMLTELKNEYPKIEIVLQVNTPALKQIGDDPKKLIQRLEGYENIIDFVLLDKSMGRGKGMDASALLPFIEAIYNSGLSLDVAVAGGLGPRTLHLVESIVKKFPFISIDSQGQLRPTGNALDPIDWKMASEYLSKAVNMFSEKI